MKKLSGTCANGACAVRNERRVSTTSVPNRQRTPFVPNGRTKREVFFLRAMIQEGIHRVYPFKRRNLVDCCSFAHQPMDQRITIILHLSSPGPNMVSIYERLREVFENKAWSDERQHSAKLDRTQDSSASIDSERRKFSEFSRSAPLIFPSTQCRVVRRSRP